MKMKLFVLLYFLFECNCQYTKTSLSMAKKVINNGYPFEEHVNVQTPDGYLLTMHRIPYGRNQTNSRKRDPVLLMHGLFGSSMQFLVGGPANSLGYLLADKGYDVWLGNVRCNTYSRHHITLNPDTDKEYWNFSLLEFGIYDLPTMIDYILNNTGTQNLYYIGHSQGNPIMFILCSEMPEYNKKLRLFVGLSPVSYFVQFPHPIGVPISKIQKDLEMFTNYLGMYELPPKRLREMANKILPVICTMPFIDDICVVFTNVFLGINAPQFKKSYMQEVLATSPQSIGTKQLYHLLQIVNAADKLQKYDYGTNKNLILYNSTKPPTFKFDNTVAPTALFYSRHDWFLSIEDAKRLIKKLPNVVLSHEIEDINFTHVDFLFAKDVIPLVFSRVFQIMDQYKTFP